MHLRKSSWLLSAALLIGCDSPPQSTPSAAPPAPVSHAPVTTAPPPPETPPEPDNGKAATHAVPDAMDLAKRSGCFACHAIDKKVVGPAWRDVAARYQNDPEARARLIKKVHEGGKGNWSEVTGGVTMPAYSPRVASADIETLVDFILNLNTEKSASP